MADAEMVETLEQLQHATVTTAQPPHTPNDDNTPNDDKTSTMTTLTIFLKQHTPNSLNLEQYIAQLPIQYDATQSSQNYFHTETKQLTSLMAPERHIWMPLIA